jgi:glycosyltransferase involved in cell wall biosynthesis
MKVLIIADYAPPYNKIGAVRVGKTAKYLKKFGHDVRILTSHHATETDLSLPVEVENHETIYASSQRFSELVPKDYWHRSAWKRLLLRLCLLLKYRNIYYLFREDSLAWSVVAKSKGQSLIDDWKPDVILSSALPIVAHVIASKLASQNKIAWVAEYRDLWSGGHGAHVDSLSQYLFPVIEKRMLKSASSLITVSQPLADHLHRVHNKRVTVVFNGYDEAVGVLSKHPNVVDDDKTLFSIVYTGAVYEGRDPSPLFEAIGLLESDIRGRLSVHFYTDDDALVTRLIHAYHVEDVVSVKARVPYSESLAVQANADVLLFLSYSSAIRGGSGILSGKAFEYLAARRPILSIGVDDGHVLCQDGLMINHHKANDIAQQLIRWTHQKSTLGHIPLEISQQKIERWSREHQTAILEKELLRAVEQFSINVERF